MIKKIVANLENTYYAKKLLSKLKYNEKKLKNKTIIIYTLRNLPVPIHIEYFLAYQLAELGANVKIIMDDGVLKHWDWIQIHNKTNYYTIYQYPTLKRIPYLIRGWLAQYPYKHKNIEKIYLSKLLKDYNIENVELEEKHKWQAESSTRRFFETGVLDLSKPEYQKYYEESLYNCKVSLLSAKILKEKYNPDMFITSHGIYSLWGPAYYYMKENGVKTYVHGINTGYRPQTLILSDVPIQILPKDSEWLRYKQNKKLSNEEKEKVDYILKKRLNFESNDTSIYFKNKISKLDKYIKNLNLENITFGLFPNIIWDGDVKERDIAFDGVLDWILYTIKIFRENQDKNLIIRFHPAESNFWSDSLSLEELVRQHYPDIDNYKNIILIPSNSGVNTYEIVKNYVDIGLIYEGMLSLEMLYLDIPVIVGGISRFSGAGMYIPQSKKEYKNWILDSKNLIKYYKNNLEEKKELFYKYTYWFLFEASKKYPILDKKELLRINYKELSFKDIENLKIIERIKNENIYNS